MKIAGYTAQIATERVVLPRADGKPIVLTVAALPIGYSSEVTSLISDPVAKSLGIETDASGRTLRDSDGAPRIKYDTQSPKFKTRQAQVNLYQNTLLVVKSLASDKGVTFEAKMERGKAEDYARAIQGELKEFGIGSGDFAILLEAVIRVSNLDNEAVKKAQKDFFSTEQAKGENSPTDAPSIT